MRLFFDWWWIFWRGAFGARESLNCSVSFSSFTLFLFLYLWIKNKRKMRRRNEEVSDKHECLNLWNNKLCNFLIFSFSQRPHPPDGDGDQSGRGSGAQDPSQIRRPRICQRKRTPLHRLDRGVSAARAPWITPPAECTLTRSCLTRQTLLYKQAKWCLAWV